MACPNNASSPIISHEVILAMQVTGGTTSVLSVLGASLIIFTYAAFKSLRTTARQLLVNLSVADIIVALSHFVGLLSNYEAKFHLNKGINEPLCDAQGAFTAFGTVASFLWSMLIAVYMLVLTQSNTLKPSKILVPIIYVASWGIPAVVLVILVVKHFLGYDPNGNPGKVYTCMISCIAVFPPCLLYTSPSPRDATLSRMPSSA